MARQIKLEDLMPDRVKVRKYQGVPGFFKALWVAILMILMLIVRSTLVVLGIAFVVAVVIGPFYVIGHFIIKFW